MAAEAVVEVEVVVVEEDEEEAGEVGDSAGNIRTTASRLTRW